MIQSTIKDYTPTKMDALTDIADSIDDFDRSRTSHAEIIPFQRKEKHLESL